MVELTIQPDIDVSQLPLGRNISLTHVAAPDPNNPRIAIIRTSDRIAFKKCRRSWGWSSHLRHNLGPKYGISALWFGTGIHFALEDFHGWNRFGHPKEAFLAFVAASKAHNPNKLPDDWKELVELGEGMMDYYVIWLNQRKNTLLKTYWYNGEPQVEVNFRFKIPGDWTHYGYDEVYYSGTIDRVCVDEFGHLWPLDYKTAKAFEVGHFLLDPQITVYMWAMPHIYPDPLGGFMYMQMKKSIPQPGRLVYSGSKISTAENQDTTWWLYRQTMIEKYGSVDASPLDNQKYLTRLAMEEDEWKDRFIQVDRIQRNDRMGQSEGAKILLELEDMLNPNLPLYPNPSRWCNHWQYPCNFLSACTSMDDGGDWMHELEMTTDPREPKYDGWRDKIIWPGETDSKAIDFGDRGWLDDIIQPEHQQP